MQESDVADFGEEDEEVTVHVETDVLDTSGIKEPSNEEQTTPFKEMPAVMAEVGYHGSKPVELLQTACKQQRQLQAQHKCAPVAWR